MTQSATGFLRALSAVSLSLVRSIAVTCSMLNTFSSSMYITYNSIREHTTAEAQERLTNIHTFIAQQIYKKALLPKLDNAGTNISQHVLSAHAAEIRFAWSRLTFIYLYARRAWRHLRQVINETGLHVLDERIRECPTVETLESLDSVFAVGDHLCFKGESCMI